MSQHSPFWLLLIGYKKNCWYQEDNFDVYSAGGKKSGVENTPMQCTVYFKIEKMFAHGYSTWAYHIPWYLSQISITQPSPVFH